MDFSKLNAQELAAKGCVFNKFVGLDHKPLKDVSVTIEGELSKHGQQVISAVNKVYIDSDLEAGERVFSINSDCAIALVSAWTGINWDGKPLECNDENKRKIFKNKGYLWFTTQVVAAIKDTSNFLSKADED